MRVGVLGGTFDPIHVGHLAAAHVAMECAHLDRVLFVPSATPPHREPAVADAKQRFEMSMSAIAGERRFEVSDIEIKRGGTSYTADTIRELKRLHPHDDLFLILGWDAAKLFVTWHEPDVIRGLASAVVVSRPGTEPPDRRQLQAAGLDPEHTVLCLGTTPDISGSELRQAIASGEAIGGRLPEVVQTYIAKHHLYADNR
jgi:nicotinate-nucleotide adenylyltransferase